MFEVVAFCGFVAQVAVTNPTQKGWGSTCVVLIISFASQCLVFIQLPYMEDLRRFTFLPLDTNKDNIPTGKQFFVSTDHGLLDKQHLCCCFHSNVLLFIMMKSTLTLTL